MVSLPAIPFPSRPPLLMRRIGILPLPTWDTASVRSQAIPRGKRQLSFPPKEQIRQPKNGESTCQPGSMSASIVVGAPFETEQFHPHRFPTLRHHRQKHFLSETGAALMSTK